MAVELPYIVWVWFGAPIEPRRVDLVAGPDVTDPPLHFDELPGWLDAWAHWPEGWQQGRAAVRPGDIWLSGPRVRAGAALHRLVSGGTAAAGLRARPESQSGGILLGRHHQLIQA